MEDVFGSKRNRESHNHLSTTNYAADVKMYSNSENLNFRKGSRKQRTRFMYWATRMKQFETIVKIDSNSKDIQLPRKRNFSIQLSRFCVVDIERIFFWVRFNQTDIRWGFETLKCLKVTLKNFA